jgi:hypothetical protein
MIAPGAVLELLVLAADGPHCAGVDLASGALVRAWSPVPLPAGLRAYDVVAATLADDADTIPDPWEPESLVLEGPPEPLRRMSGRRTERMLRALLHPTGQPLLGETSPAIPFWERRADHPSIALVEPEGRVSLFREGSYLSCRFQWWDHVRQLPCLDRHLAAAMDRTGRTRMVAGKDDRLLVALTPPIDGRCHIVVEAVLPRP